TSTTSTTTSTTLAFGGDDTGCVPDTKGHLKCGDGLGKAFGKAIRAVIKCHQKQAHAAFAGPPADDEACEEGTGTGKAAKEKLDAAITKLSPLCSGQQLSGPTAEEACEETDPVKHKAAHEKYSAAMDKLDLKGTCTQTCLSRTSRDMLAANVISQIEAANEVAYPCP